MVVKICAITAPNLNLLKLIKSGARLIKSVLTPCKTYQDILKGFTDDNEVKYEDICQDPISIFTQLFNFIEVPFLESNQHWLTQTVYAGKIAKWKKLSADKLKAPLQIAEPLLKDLGYIKTYTSIKENTKITNKPSALVLFSFANKVN